VTDYNLLLPPPSNSQASYWATVTQASPLRVQLDGDPGALSLTPDTLVYGLQVNDRVRVELDTNSDATFKARRVVVIGKAGGVAPTNPFPVGAIYLSVVSTDPGTLFGGTWTRIQDTFLLAAGSTYAAASTGGEATHVLTSAEMPSHTHALTVAFSNVTPLNSASYPSGFNSNNSGTGVVPTANGGPANTGGGGAHNNMPPYLAVYVWKRTA